MSVYKIINSAFKFCFIIYNVCSLKVLCRIRKENFMQKPVMLLILDGWGYREKTTKDNSIEMGETPNWHELLKTCPHSFIETSGLDVGLPDGQMGNSEVGHMNLGAGRVVYQDLTRVTKAIRDGEFFANPTINAAVDHVKKNHSSLH